MIEIGEVAIDTGAKRVTLDGKPVVLTAREYAIVELLALHRGQVVTRTQIYEHIFDENDDSLSNLVEVHVMNVRKKLGKDFIAHPARAGIRRSMNRSLPLAAARLVRRRPAGGGRRVRDVALCAGPVGAVPGDRRGA